MKKIDTKDNETIAHIFILFSYNILVQTSFPSATVFATPY